MYMRPTVHFVLLLDLFRVRHENGRGPTYVPVTFVRYDACPAIVVVFDGEGRLLRVQVGEVLGDGCDFLP
jgi:hypothetical protein